MIALQSGIGAFGLFVSVLVLIFIVVGFVVLWGICVLVAEVRRESRKKKEKQATTAL